MGEMGAGSAVLVLMRGRGDSEVGVGVRGDEGGTAVGREGLYWLAVERKKKFKPADCCLAG